MSYSEVAKTYGALLVGGFIAASLSGVVALQCLIYIKLFPNDHPRVKAIVAVVWTLDLAHSLMVYASIWRYVIIGFGDYDEVDVIPHTLALTVLLTGFLTFIVHCFFAHRIHRLRSCDWRITTLIGILAMCRVSASTATTTQMIRLKTLTAFKASFRWLFTLGLALSCAEDIMIATLLVYSLQSLQGPTGRIASSSLDRVVSSVIIYTLETNSLTGAATVVCMICWIVMPNNLVFMASHFFICKLYANSLLAALNTRSQLRNQRQRPFSPDFALTLPPSTQRSQYSSQVEPPSTTKVDIDGGLTLESSSDGRPPPVSQRPSGRLASRDSV